MDEVEVEVALDERPGFPSSLGSPSPVGHPQRGRYENLTGSGLPRTSGEQGERRSADAEEHRPVGAGGAEDLHAASDRHEVRRQGSGVESRVHFPGCLRLLDAPGVIVLEAPIGAASGLGDLRIAVGVVPDADREGCLELVPALLRISGAGRCQQLDVRPDLAVLPTVIARHRP